MTIHPYAPLYAGIAAIVYYIIAGLRAAIRIIHITVA
jgi:hypothetical protein